MSYPFAQTQDGLNLRDIHMPPAPSWWPPAPGWWIVLAVACCIVVIAMVFYRRVRRHRQLHEQVIAEISVLANQYANDDTAYAASIHQLLRRVARYYAIDAHRLQGSAWREVLARVPVDNATLDTLMELDASIYQPYVQIDRTKVHAAVHQWLNTALKCTKLARVLQHV